MALRRLFVLLALVIATAAIAAGCGSDSDDDGGGSNTGTNADGVSTPAPLEADGEFLFCTDVPYPPAEFLEKDGSFAGYEVEMAEEIAERIGTDAEFQKTGFDGIIAALLADKCDAIVSSMNVTPEREKEVAFVEYMTIGQAVAVGPDDEGSIESLEDLGGKTVAVQVGTTLKDAIDKANADLDDKIELKTYPDAGAAALALQKGDVDAFFADAPVVADYVGKDPESFAIGGTQIDELPAGIALRKGDTELQEAVQDAVDEMYADGTMLDIFEKWNVDEFVLEDK